MGFSEKQVSALRATSMAIASTQGSPGPDLSYIEGWHAIAEANRIFGFDGWDRETVETSAWSAETPAAPSMPSMAKVRITVRAEGETVFREGYGTGEAQGSSAGATHEKALKTAETDNALATFGKPFGLASSRPATAGIGGVANPLLGAPPIPDHARRRTQQRVGRNGRYFVPARAKAMLDPALSTPSPGQPESTAPGQSRPRTGHGLRSPMRPKRSWLLRGAHLAEGSPSRPTRRPPQAVIGIGTAATCRAPCRGPSCIRHRSPTRRTSQIGFAPPPLQPPLPKSGRRV